MKISKSPQRNTFMKESHIKNALEKGEEPNEEYLKMIDEWNAKDIAQVEDPEWQKNNMEYDLRTCDWILEKVRTDQVYAQNLYSAMCNVEWCKRELWKVLKEEYWGCSWRHAGGIIADMRQEGDYIDWYCSGIREDLSDADIAALPLGQQESYRTIYSKYVPEGCVTEQIEKDLNTLGWFPVPYNK